MTLLLKNAAGNAYFLELTPNMSKVEQDQCWQETDVLIKEQIRQKKHPVLKRLETFFTQKKQQKALQEWLEKKKQKSENTTLIQVGMNHPIWENFTLQHQWILLVQPPKKYFSATNVVSPNPHLFPNQAAITWLSGWIIPNAPQPDWGEKMQIREAVTEGRDYFITRLSGHSKEQIVVLLKAFTLFKKRQHSGMAWLFVGTEQEVEQWENWVTNYKLKTHLCAAVQTDEEDWYRWLSAAYAQVHLPDQLGFHQEIFDGLSMGCPTAIEEKLAEIMSTSGPGNWPLSTTKADPEILGETLKNLFKNETWRNQLAVEGLQLAQHSGHNEQFTKILIGQF